MVDGLLDYYMPVMHWGVLLVGEWDGLLFYGIPPLKVWFGVWGLEIGGLFIGYLYRQ